MQIRPLLLGLLASLPSLACGDAGSVGVPPPPGTEGTWAALTPMSEARQEVGVAVIGNRIYVVGGFRTNGSTANTVEVYDVAADRWSFGPPLPVAVNHPGAAALGGLLYVVAGATATGPTAALQAFDPGRNVWEARTPMAVARSAVMTGTLGGKLYVAGGSPAGQAFEVYDPATDRWTSLAELPTGRNHLAGGFIGGRLHAVGGRPPLTLATHEAFDVAAARWGPLAPMPTGRSGHAAALVRGCLYVMGGEGNPNAGSGTFAENEGYDPRTDQWFRLLPMPTPRHGIGAVVVGDRIYIPGGATIQGFGAVTTHEVFTPASTRSCL